MCFQTMCYQYTTRNFVFFFVLRFLDFFDPTVHLYKLQTKIRRDQCPCSFLLMITYEQIVSSRNTIYRNSQEPRLYLQFCEWEDQLAACLAHSSFCNQFIPPFWTLTLSLHAHPLTRLQPAKSSSLSFFCFDTLAAF